jgi:hypothetical protein
MHPNGTVWVQEGEMICFNINPVQVNSPSGLAFLNVDQHFNTKRADRLRNGN